MIEDVVFKGLGRYLLGILSFAITLRLGMYLNPINLSDHQGRIKGGGGAAANW